MLCHVVTKMIMISHRGIHCLTPLANASLLFQTWRGIKIRLLLTNGTRLKNGVMYNNPDRLSRHPEGVNNYRASAVTLQTQIKHGELISCLLCDRSDGDHVLTLARYVYAQLLVSLGIIFKISENRFLNVTTLMLPAAAIFAWLTLSSFSFMQAA